MAKRVGFIGLGFMGRPMCRNLLKAGFPLTIYDVVSERVQALAAEGARAAASPRELAGDADVVITMVPADPHVEQALLGPDGALDGMRPGTTVIQMSTIKPSTLRRIAATVQARGVRIMDAPVTQGARVAEGGLTIYVGGDPALLEEHRDVLRAMGQDIHHAGELGSGQATKLVNNLLVLGQATMVAEALVFARQMGLDPERLYEVIKAGTGDSVAWRWCIPDMVGRVFEPEVRGTIDIVAKDLSLALSYGQEVHAPMLLTPLAQQLYAACQARGDGDKHFPFVVTLYEALAGLGTE